MTEQELAGMIWGIKEIIRGVYDDTEEILSELMALENDTTSALQNLINETK